MASEDVAKVEELIVGTLEKVEQEGFSMERLDGILHQLELRSKHVAAQFGMNLLQAVITPLMHHVDPVALMRSEPYIARLRQELAADPRFLCNVIREKLLNNPERLTLVMSPSEQYMDDVQQLEQQQLADVAAGLSAEDVEHIKSQSEELQTRQALPQDPSCLPTLSTAEDIPRHVPRTRISTRADHDRQFVSEQPTNGLVYFRGVSAAPSSAVLTEHGLLNYMPLWSSLIGRLPTSTLGHRELAQKVELLTGGIGIGLGRSSDPLACQRAFLQLNLSGTCLAKNTEALGDLLSDILANTVYDSEEALQLLRITIDSAAADKAEALVTGGQAYAIARASSQMSPSAWLGDKTEGLEQLIFIQQLARDISDPETGSEAVVRVAERLQQLHQLIMVGNGSGNLQRTIVTSESGLLRLGDDLNASVADALGGWHVHDSPVIPGAAASNTTGAITFGEQPDLDAGALRQCLPINGEVSFAARAIQVDIPFTSPEHVALTLGSRMMGSCFLHREIRERGGAYGSGASFAGPAFLMHSYRDPEPLSSISTFEKVLPWLQGQNIHENTSGDITPPPPPTERDLEEAKLSLFGDLDAPTSPMSKGLPAWRGITPEVRDARREQVFNITLDDVLSTAETYLSEEKLKNADSCVVASELQRTAFEEQGWHLLN